MAYLLTYLLTLYHFICLFMWHISYVLTFYLTLKLRYVHILCGILSGTPPRLIFFFLHKVHPIPLAATFHFCMDVRYGRGHSGTDGIHGLSSWSCIVAEASDPKVLNPFKVMVSAVRKWRSVRIEGRHLVSPHKLTIYSWLTVSLTFYSVFTFSMLPGTMDFSESKGCRVKSIHGSSLLF